MSPISSVYPWYRDDIKREHIFHFKNLGRIFSNRKRRRWEDAVIHLHWGATRRAALYQTKKCGDNPACSHLTKEAQSIIPLAPLCYSLDLPHYWKNYLHTHTHTHIQVNRCRLRGLWQKWTWWWSKLPPETDLSPSGTPVNDLCHGCVGIH